MLTQDDGYPAASLTLRCRSQLDAWTPANPVAGHMWDLCIALLHWRLVETCIHFDAVR